MEIVEKEGLERNLESTKTDLSRVGQELYTVKAKYDSESQKCEELLKQVASGKKEMDVLSMGSKRLEDIIEVRALV